MDGDTAGVAEVFGLFATVWGLVQFLCSPSPRRPVRPLWPALRYPDLLPGLGLDDVFMALVPSLALLLVGRVISGITAATISAAFAYIADITTTDGRAKAFRIVVMAFGAGFVMGPAIWTGNSGHMSRLRRRFGARPVPRRKQPIAQYRRAGHPGPLRRSLCVADWPAARRTLLAGRHASHGGRLCRPDRYVSAASRRPVLVSLQTIQSGLSGLLNQGSAQPRLMQRRTIARSMP